MADERGGKEFFFLKKKFSEYYSKNLPLPAELARREFGFGWDKKIDYRHKAFASPEEFRYFMANEAPLYCSYSTAYYELPAARPMEKKGFLGTDIVFDTDRQYTDEPHKHNSLICPYCLERARQDALRLHEEFVCGDFGFSPAETSVNFSGSKGFHVHIAGAAVRQLSQSARSQLVDYVQADGVELARLVTGMAGDKEKGKRTKAAGMRGPGRDSTGWAKKVFDYSAGFVSRASLDSFKEAGFNAKQAEKIVEEKEFVLKKMGEGNWDAVPGLEKLWKKTVPWTIEKKKVVVDRSVTTDQARLIRLPGSLHGDTGLIAKKCNLKTFDPLKDAVAFGSEIVRVRPEEDVVVPLGGEEREIKANASVDVPMAAAILLLCKKKAVLVQEY